MNIINLKNKIINGISKTYYDSKYKKNPLDVKVLTIEDTVDYINSHHSSVARFGDGEINIITGHDIPYQNYDSHLAKRLFDIMSQENTDTFLVCVPDIFDDLEQYMPESRSLWSRNRVLNRDIYQQTLSKQAYGNAFISRPYREYHNKDDAEFKINKIKSLWTNRDILIVEGITSRSGVGNSLFDNAKSISRIICPSANAFYKYEEIKETIEFYGENKLVLIMLGPTAKLLAYDLATLGIQAIDIGHIDTEFEWFNIGAMEKVKLPHKHTAEFNYDENIILPYDTKYESEILKNLS